MRQSILSTTLAEGDYRCDLIAQAKNGVNFAVEFSATLLRDASSTPTAIVASVTRANNGDRDARPALGSKSAGIISRKIDETEFILASPIMHQFMALVYRVASHTETVLITGETGTGEELIARTVHHSSSRRAPSVASDPQCKGEAVQP